MPGEKVRQQAAAIDAPRISVEDDGSAGEGVSTKQVGGGRMQLSSWEKMELEQLNPRITRQMMSGEHATVAKIVLKKGAVVPRHAHVSEQFSWIVSGALKFVFDGREIVARAGDVVFIPSNEPHAAEAVEDTVDVDFFAPRREDWITKNDAYLRG